MAKNRAPLLPQEVADQAREIANAIRKHEVAPLVGSGLSYPRGVPKWTDLVDNLIRAWRKWDPSSSAQKLSADEYVKLMREVFRNSDLTVVSYLRSSIESRQDLSFGQLLFSALYSIPYEEEERYFEPEPSDIHRHLVKIFEAYPRRIWTTNYDDLLEEAARSAGVAVTTLDPLQRKSNDDLLIAHLHGFLPPKRAARNYPDPSEARTIFTLSDEDFHVIASDTVGWTNRQFYQLFDEHRALILGMSLDDPNVRRVLASNLRQVEGQAQTPKHYALMSQLKLGQDALPASDVETLAVAARDADRFRQSHWKHYGVEVVTLPSHELTLAFVMRLRYESYGTQRGDLWARGAQLGYEAVNPADADQQKIAGLILRDALNSLQRDFSVSTAEIVEIGLFLLKPDRKTLELVFRSDPSKAGRTRKPTFSGDPDRPTGVAGRVFVAAEGVRVSRADPLHDFGFKKRSRASGSDYEGIISVPVIDWQNNGAPLGVIYVTTSALDGTLFGLPESVEPGFVGKTLDDLYQWLHILAVETVDLLRRKPG